MTGLSEHRERLKKGDNDIKIVGNGENKRVQFAYAAKSSKSGQFIEIPEKAVRDMAANVGLAQREIFQKAVFKLDAKGTSASAGRPTGFKLGK